MGFLLFVLGVAVAGAAGGGAGLAVAVARFVLWALGISTEDGTLAIVHDVLEDAASLSSAMGFLIPWFTSIPAIRREGTVGRRSSVSYVAGFINCVFLAVYAASQKGNSAMTLTNMVGLVSMFCCLLKFIEYCDADELPWALVFPISGVLSIPCFLGIYLSDMDRYLLFFSWVCALSRSFTTLVPFLNLGVVHQDRNMNAMPPIVMSASSLVTSALLIAFGCTDPSFDGFIVWPGVVGFISAAIQLLLHYALRENGGPVQPQE